MRVGRTKKNKVKLKWSIKSFLNVLTVSLFPTISLIILLSITLSWYESESAPVIPNELSTGVPSYSSTAIYSSSSSAAFITSAPANTPWLQTSDYPTATPASSRTFLEVDPDSPSTTVIYMVAGQSNACGTNSIGDSPTAYSDPHITQIDQNGNIIAAVDPLRSVTPSGVAFTMSFANSMYKLKKQDITIVSCAYTGTAFFNYWTTTDFFWNPFPVISPDPTYTSKSLYYNCYRLVNLLLSSTTKNYTMGAILWLQGESNTGGTGTVSNNAALPSGTSAAVPNLNENNYATTLRKLIWSFRNDFGYPNLPFIMAGVSPAQYGVNTPISNAARHMPFDTPYFSSVQGLNPNTTYMQYTTGGPIHYDWNALRQMGFDMVNAYHAAVAHKPQTYLPGRPPQVFFRLNTLAAKSVTVGWVQDPIASGYDLRLNGVVTAAVIDNSGVAFLPDKLVQSKLVGLTSGTFYSLSVRSTLNSYASDWTTPLNFTTPSNPQPFALTNLPTAWFSAKPFRTSNIALKPIGSWSSFDSFALTDVNNLHATPSINGNQALVMSESPLTSDTGFPVNSDFSMVFLLSVVKPGVIVQNGQFQLGVDDNHKPYIKLFNSATFTSTGTIALYRFETISVTYVMATRAFNIYIGSTPSGTFTGTNQPYIDPSLSLGSFAGAVSEFMLFNTALSSVSTYDAAIRSQYTIQTSMNPVVGGCFSPAQATGPVASIWLSACVLAQSAADNSPVYLWYDQVSGNDPSPALRVNTPTFHSLGPRVEVASGSAISVPYTSSGSFTHIFAVNVNCQTAYSWLFHVYGEVGAIQTTQSSISIYTGTGSFSLGNFGCGSPYLLTIIYDASTQSAVSYKNGVIVNAGVNIGTLGSRPQPVLGSSMDGDIYEWVMFFSALTHAQARVYEVGIAAQYGISYSG